MMMLLTNSSYTAKLPYVFLCSINLTTIEPSCLILTQEYNLVEDYVIKTCERKIEHLCAHAINRFFSSSRLLLGSMAQGLAQDPTDSPWFNRLDTRKD